MPSVKADYLTAVTALYLTAGDLLYGTDRPDGRPNEGDLVTMAADLTAKRKRDRDDLHDSVTVAGEAGVRGDVAWDYPTLVRALTDECVRLRRSADGQRKARDGFVTLLSASHYALLMGKDREADVVRSWQDAARTTDHPDTIATDTGRYLSGMANRQRDFRARVRELALMLLGACYRSGDDSTAWTRGDALDIARKLIGLVDG